MMTLKNHRKTQKGTKDYIQLNLIAYERQFGWGDSLLNCNKGLHKV